MAGAEVVLAATAAAAPKHSLAAVETPTIRTRSSSSAASPCHEEKSPLQFVHRAARGATEAVQHGCGALAQELHRHVRRWEREQTRRKISEHLVIVQQARLEVEQAESRMSRSRSFESLGDLGVALFSPLEGALDGVGSSGTKDRDDDKEDASSRDDSLDMTSDTDSSESPSVVAGDVDSSVTVLPESGEEFVPYLLSEATRNALRQALPPSLHTKSWVRLYSVARDGDSFGTFLRRVQGHRQTLVVVETSNHELIGGFADSRWGQQPVKRDGRYYGTGTSFLYSITPGKHGRDEDDGLVVHRWKGVNEYSQLCRTKDGCIAMGGGGTFGLCIQDDFTRGASGPCLTFGNMSPLSSTEHFDVVNFEVYGFEYSWP